MTSNDQPNYDELIAFASGELEGEAAQRVQRYIEKVPEAAATVSNFRNVLNRMQAAYFLEPPPNLIAKAKHVFRATLEDTDTSGSSLFDRLGAVIAHLVFDSRLHPLAVRGSGDVVQMTYEVQGCEVDLRAERKPGATAVGVWEVMGQVSSEGETLDNVEIVAVDAKTNRIVARAPLDDTSMFSIELPDGWYDLGVQGPSTILVLPELLLE